jgi:hypothetical protein
MKIVHTVSEGSYSDYQICRLFESESMAEEYCKKMNLEYYLNNPHLEEKYKTFDKYLEREGPYYLEEFDVVEEGDD